MRPPESNGLFEVTGGKPQKERGFNCMQLIVFLTADGMVEWDDWHGAHLDAAAGQCHYTAKCPIYARTMEKQKKNN